LYFVGYSNVNFPEPSLLTDEKRQTGMEEREGEFIDLFSRKVQRKLISRKELPLKSSVIYATEASDSKRLLF
jgi:hypothetical protein